ncbi:MAG: hypothetical protein RJA44_894 [Pseudomonadota bacterium]
MNAPATRLHLLDSRTLAALMQQPQGPIARRIEQIGENQVATSLIVACELRHAVARQGSLRLAERLEELLAVLPVLPLEPDTDRHYALIRHALERAGQSAESTELLLAAHARGLDAVLVCAQPERYAAIPALTALSWLD